MRSAIALLTFNRKLVLQETLMGLLKHCGHYPIFVFDDMSCRDDTTAWLIRGAKHAGERPGLMADCYVRPDGITVYVGRKNLGVAGNSNRALKVLMDETDADHLCLLNDDLHILGDFVRWYASAHQDLKIGMFSFCDFTHHPSYRWIDVRKQGYIVKICPRMTAIMTSMTRDVVKAIGYYDAQFGKFGQEHCDHMNRTRLAGFMHLDGMMQPQLDVHHYMSSTEPRVLLKHQECETSVVGIDRRAAGREADGIMQMVGKSYRYRHLYRPFCLHLPKVAGAHGNQGIPVDDLSLAYRLVTDFWPEPLAL
jgi:hypothetical protein